MKILVFDDNQLNLQSAEEQLAQDHELTLVDDYGEAEKILGGVKQLLLGPNPVKEVKPDFDIVLTDLLVPAPSRGVSQGNGFIGTLMPMGMFIALLCLKQGIRKVGILTLTNHHDHPASSALDAFGGYWNEISLIGDSRLLAASSLGYRLDPETMKRLSVEQLKTMSAEALHKYPVVKDWKEAVELLCA